MSTALSIAIKENRDTMRDGRFRWTVFILAILLSGSLVTGWHYYDRVQLERHAAAEAERQVWVEQGEKNPHSAAHYGTYAFKPYMPLGAIDRGLEPYTGTTIFLEAHARNPEAFRSVEDLNAAHRLGQLVTSTVLQLLLPLLIILLTFSMFCGEREQGTLRMILSTGISRKQLAMGKLLGLSIPLTAVLVPATAVGILALALFGGPDSSLWSWSRVVVLMAVYFVYFAIFVGLSLVVSALAPTSRFSLVFLTGFWFLTSFVMPRLAADGVERITPLPTAAEFQTAISKDIDGLIGWTDRTQQVTERLMKEHKVNKAEELPFDPDGFVLMEAEEDETRIYREHFDELTDRYEQQAWQYQFGGLPAPLVALRSLSMAVSGTDYGHHRQFADAAETYRFNYVQDLNTHLSENMKPGERYLADRSLWEAVKAFSYEPPSLSHILSQQVLSLVFLGLWALAVLAAIPVALKRMRAF